MFGFKLRPVFKQYIIVCIANFTFLHIGLSISWLSPVMVILRNANQTVLPEPLTEEQMSWILSISSIVDILTFFFAGYVTDKLGRKYSMILSCVPRLIMCIIFIFTSQVWMLLLARFICGFSDAFIITIVSTYVSEIASKEVRGGLGTISQISYSIGLMIFLAVGPFVSFMSINLIFTTIVVLTCIPILLLPESPYFLYITGRTDESMKLLTSLRGSEALALLEIAEYNNINIKINKIELIKNKTVLKTLGKVLFLCIGVPWTGYLYITFNLQTIFEMTNTTVSSGVSSLVIGFVTLFASCCTIYLSDRFGKKPVLTIALIGQAVGMVGLGTFFKLTQDNEITGFLNYLPLISMVLSIYCYSAGPGSLLWILYAELFEGPLRAFGVSFGVFVLCIGAFPTIKYMIEVMHVIGIASTYWMFAGFCVIISGFVQIFIPETKGKTFSQIQSEMRSDNRGLIPFGVPSQT